jgi:hypothetical protein
VEGVAMGFCSARDDLYSLHVFHSAHGHVLSFEGVFDVVPMVLLVYGTKNNKPKDQKDI